MAANCMSSHGDTCHFCEPPHGPGLAPIVSGLVWLPWSAGSAGDPKAVRWTQVGVWMQRNPRIKNGATQKAASEVFCEDRRIMGEAQMPGRLGAHAVPRTALGVARRCWKFPAGGSAGTLRSFS